MQHDAHQPFDYIEFCDVKAKVTIEHEVKQRKRVMRLYCLLIGVCCAQ